MPGFRPAILSVPLIVAVALLRNTFVRFHSHAAWKFVLPMAYAASWAAYGSSVRLPNWIQSSPGFVR